MGWWTVRVGLFSAALHAPRAGGSSLRARAPDGALRRAGHGRVHLRLAKSAQSFAVGSLASPSHSPAIASFARRSTTRIAAAEGVSVFDDDEGDEAAEATDPEGEEKEEEEKQEEEASSDDDIDDDIASRAERIEAAKRRMEEEDAREPMVVLGSPVCDAFSALVLELRAGGHGTLKGPDPPLLASAPADDGASIDKISSWSNPEPWSTFSGLDEYQVKACLGDVRRTLKAYAAHAATPGALSERLMGAVGAAWLQTAAEHASPEEGKQAAFVWGGGEKFAVLLNDTCVHHLLFRDEPAAAGNRLVADTLMVLQDLATVGRPSDDPVGECDSPSFNREKAFEPTRRVKTTLIALLSRSVCVFESDPHRVPLSIGVCLLPFKPLVKKKWGGATVRRACRCRRTRRRWRWRRCRLSSSR